MQKKMQNQEKKNLNGKILQNNRGNEISNSEY